MGGCIEGVCIKRVCVLRGCIKRVLRVRVIGCIESVLRECVGIMRG